MKFQSVVLLAVVAVASFTSGETPRQFYCGRRLANTLAYICDADIAVKRSGPYISLPEYDGEFGWPWMSSSGARALDAGRGKRGVASECCDKPCSIEELLTYC
ncbi:bombyxin A-1 homolog [Aphomia sociella]